MTARIEKIKRFCDVDVDVAEHITSKATIPPAQIANALGIDLHTLWLWVHNPDYWRRLAQKRDLYGDWDETE